MMLDTMTNYPPFRLGERKHVMIGDLALAYLDDEAWHLEPVILVHGFTDSANTWDLLVPWLAEHRRIIRLDLRGHGGSMRPDSGYDLDSLAGDLIRFTAALGIGQADYVGHSLGSLVVARLAALAPERVRAMVLISSTASVDDSATMRVLHDSIAGLRDPIDPESEFLRGWCNSPTPVDVGFVARERQMAAQMPARLWQTILREALDLGDLDRNFAQVTAPSLLLWGDADAIFDQPHRDSLIRAMPHGKVRNYAGLGHNPFWEQPQRVAADILDHLQ